MTIDHEKPFFEPKKLGALFKWLKVFLLIYIASELFITVGSLLSLQLGTISFGYEYDFTFADLIVSIGAVFLSISFFVTIVLFCIFSFRSAKNLKNWNVREFETSPGWAVGWYFIPIANLWKPYGVMDQIWSGSQAILSKTTSAPSYMGVWWACWIISNIVSNLSFRLGLEAGVFDDVVSNLPLYKATLVMDAVSGVLGILAAYYLLKLTKTIAGNQDSYINSMAFE